MLCSLFRMYKVGLGLVAFIRDRALPFQYESILHDNLYIDNLYSYMLTYYDKYIVPVAMFPVVKFQDSAHRDQGCGRIGLMGQEASKVDVHFFNVSDI